MGIALTVGVFAVVDAYLLTPLPFPHAERLVSVESPGPLSWDEVEDVFETPVSWDLDVFTVVGDGRPELLRGAWITPGFMDTYGVAAALGRGFRPEEAGRDAAPVAMISHELWQRRYGGDPNIIGSRLSAFTSDRPEDAETFTIVGVLAADSWLRGQYADFLAPLREDRMVYAGRLREGLHPVVAADLLQDRARERMGSASDEIDVRGSTLRMWSPQTSKVEVVSVNSEPMVALWAILKW